MIFFNLWTRTYWSGPPSYIYADASMVLFSLGKIFSTITQGEPEAKELEKKISLQVERLLKVVFVIPLSLLRPNRAQDL